MAVLCEWPCFVNGCMPWNVPVNLARLVAHVAVTPTVFGSNDYPSLFVDQGLNAGPGKLPVTVVIAVAAVVDDAVVVAAVACFFLLFALLFLLPCCCFVGAACCCCCSCCYCCRYVCSVGAQRFLLFIETLCCCMVPAHSLQGHLHHPCCFWMVTDTVLRCRRSTLSCSCAACATKAFCKTAWPLRWRLGCSQTACLGVRVQGGGGGHWC